MWSPPQRVKSEQQTGGWQRGSGQRAAIARRVMGEKGWNIMYRLKMSSNKRSRLLVSLPRFGTPPPTTGQRIGPWKPESQQLLLVC